MRGRFLQTCALVAIGFITACDDPAPVRQAAPPKIAATEPAPLRQATRPAALININGQEAVFPPARLRLETEGDHLIAMLFSDDPREALKPNYTGNSFYLRMELSISDPAELSQARWEYQAPSGADHDDSPYGIFLLGRRTQLEPFNVRAVFREEADGVVTVAVAGEFHVIEPNADPGPPRTAAVSAELTAHLAKTPGR
jgi:hypothetical protein